MSSHNQNHESQLHNQNYESQTHNLNHESQLHSQNHEWQTHNLNHESQSHNLNHESHNQQSQLALNYNRQAEANLRRTVGTFSKKVAKNTFFQNQENKNKKRVKNPIFFGIYQIFDESTFFSLFNHDLKK